MALRPFYTDESEIPQGLEGAYEANDDGRFMLQVEPVEGFALEDVSGLKSTLGKLKERATKAESQLKGFSALERSADELATSLAELDQLKSNGQPVNEQVERLQKELESVRIAAKAETEKTVAPIQESLDRRTEQLKTLLLDNQLTSAITQAGGSVPLLLDALKRYTRVREDDDGNIVAEVVDGDGSPRVTGADLSPMPFSALVEEIKTNDQYAPAFIASGHSGGGTQASSPTTNGQPTPAQVENMSMAEYRQWRSEQAA